MENNPTLFRLMLRDKIVITQHCTDCTTIQEYREKLEKARREGDFILLVSLDGSDVAINVDHIIYVEKVND